VVPGDVAGSRSGERSRRGERYLLPAAPGEVSHWHRVDAAETWHHYEGAPLELEVSTDGASEQVVELGPDLAAGQQPQFVVPADTWQSARSLGEHTLVGCTVLARVRVRWLRARRP